MDLFDRIRTFDSAVTREQPAAGSAQRLDSEEQSHFEKGLRLAERILDIEYLAISDKESCHLAAISALAGLVTDNRPDYPKAGDLHYDCFIKGFRKGLGDADVNDIQFHLSFLHPDLLNLDGKGKDFISGRFFVVGLLNEATPLQASSAPVCVRV